jgi:hypothetical protein
MSDEWEDDMPRSTSHSVGHRLSLVDSPRQEESYLRAVAAVAAHTATGAVGGARGQEGLRLRSMSGDVSSHQ